MLMAVTMSRWGQLALEPDDTPFYLPRIVLCVLIPPPAR
jgi:hypothetical protein